MKKYLPRLIAWEITRTCNLDCIHCRASAKYGPHPEELTKEECFHIIDSISSFSSPVIIFTGGEPIMREDFFHIAQYGKDKGLKMVMSSNGTTITKELVREIIKAGIERVSISLDGATRESHDNFRKVKGAFDGALRGIHFLKEAGVEFQLNTTITKHNIRELNSILELAESLGAAAFHVFLLVPTGRAKDLKDMEISSEEYEDTLNWLYEQKERIHLKATCAPHYHRILIQRQKGKRMGSMGKGCMGGESFAFISHIGQVQICGYLDITCGDLRKENFDFESIWNRSKIFWEMRNTDAYHGKCGVCEYRNVCGGCRARAYALTGDYLAEEPYCTYVPKKWMR